MYNELIGSDHDVMPHAAWLEPSKTHRGARPEPGLAEERLRLGLRSGDPGRPECGEPGHRPCVRSSSKLQASQCSRQSQEQRNVRGAEGRHRRVLPGYYLIHVGFEHCGAHFFDLLGGPSHYSGYYLVGFVL